MFTGIVQEIGTVESLELRSGILDITFSCRTLSSEIKTGDSIAIDGCCQTVIETTQHLFKVQATDETLKRTNFKDYKVGSKVNLEPCLRAGDKLGGHLVLGHIDDTGKVSDILSIDGNKVIRILHPEELNDFIAQKGSIAVNGISLTVVESKSNNFSFSLIPYTFDNTNLGLIKVGDLVNLEVDVVSRYLINYLKENSLLHKR